MDDNSLLRFIHSAPDEAALSQACAAISKVLGYEYFAYLLRRPYVTESPHYYVLHNFPQHWENTYQSRRFIRTDPVMYYVYYNNLPATWHEIARAYPDNASFFDTAAQQGFRYGLTAPVHDHENNTAQLSLCGSRAPHVQACEQAKNCLLWFALNVHERLKKIKPSLHQIDQCLLLSESEKQCLVSAALGYKAAEIAQKTGFTTNTVNYYLQKAAKKLGVKGKYNAVLKAISTGQISPETIDYALEDRDMQIKIADVS